MKRIVQTFKPYIFSCFVAFALLYAQAQCDLALPDYMSRIISQGIALSDMNFIYSSGLQMLLISLLGGAAAIAVGYTASRIGANFSKDLRLNIFNKVSGFGSDEFDRLQVSSLITRSTNDVTQIQLFVIIAIRMLFYAPIMGFGGVLKAIEKSKEMPQLGNVVFIAVLALVAFIAIMLMVVQPRFVFIQKLTDKLNLVAREGITGLLVIRAFNNDGYEEKRFDDVNSELTKTNIFVNRFMTLLMPFMMLIMNGVSLSVVFVASIEAKNIADVGNMMAFMQYSMQIIMSFMMVSMMFVMMPRAIVSIKRINEIFDTKDSIIDKENPINDAVISGNVEFHNVTFSYHDSEAPAISNISFVAKKGETTAIIGATGSGKSTIVNLIPRLYDVQSGSIKIDGIDVRDMSLEFLRKNIGYVPQKNILFSGTIAENIDFSGNAYSDEEILRIASIAQAEEFIKSKEDGLQTHIAQGGQNVSGGQKQRLSIARAVAKKSPINIFDDSFSALDFATDAALRSELSLAMNGACQIIVAQRVGTIMDADKIIVLEDGCIVGSGTHKQLLKSCPIYLEIASSQLSQAELFNEEVTNG